MHIEQWPIDRPLPYARNARKITPAAITKVAASLKEFGWRQPIVVDGEGVIIAGHTRLLAAQKLGLAEVPVHVAAGLTAAQVKAYRLMDNRSHQEATWDVDLLGPELLDLKELDFDLDLTGFEAFEVDGFLAKADASEGLTDPDACPQVPEFPVTEPGDLWVLGRHRLLCGDSTSIDAVERLMDGAKADMVFTDPPYNVDYSNQDRPKAGKTDLGRIKNDSMCDEDFTQFLREVYANIFAATSDDAAVYVWYASKMTVPFYAAFEGTGIEVNQQIVWKKPMLLGRGRYQWAHEPCIFAVKGSPYHTEDRTKTTVWDFGGYDKSKNVHPTQKPTVLAEEALSNSSKAGDVALDLFGGSGSTLIACEKTGRNARLMELDPKYCDVIVKRWQEFTGKKATLDGDGRTFAELAQQRIGANAKAA
jgi:DNA modification methylase